LPLWPCWCFNIGLAPGIVLRAIDPTLNRVLDEMKGRSAVTAVMDKPPAGPDLAALVQTRSVNGAPLPKAGQQEMK